MLGGVMANSTIRHPFYDVHIDLDNDPMNYTADMYFSRLKSVLKDLLSKQEDKQVLSKVFLKAMRRENLDYKAMVKTKNVSQMMRVFSKSSHAIPFKPLVEGVYQF